MEAEQEILEEGLLEGLGAGAGVWALHGLIFSSFILFCSKRSRQQYVVLVVVGGGNV